MYCPLCGGEYRPGFTVCSDCQVALVPDPPRAGSPNASNDNSDEKSFALVWSGNDSRLHAEICEALDREKIPARSLGSEDHLFNLATRPAFEVYVPADLVNSAREAIKQVAAMEEIAEPSESDLLEIPAEEGSPNDNDEDEEERRDSRGLDPQDATVAIWSGQNRELAAMIASSLRENHIPYRSDPDLSDPDLAAPPDIAGSDIAGSDIAGSDIAEPDIPGPDSAEKSASDQMRPTRLFVFPEDEKSAKEIVREIVNAAPPE
jgi:hypothetical protein